MHKDKRAAVFLDRDGVLIEDVDLLTACDQIHLYPYVPDALNRLHNAGFTRVVVTNQTVVSRGLIDEKKVQQLHFHLNDLIKKNNGSVINRFYYCPHHPNATDENYKRNCNCRKPQPGLIFRAAEEMNLDLTNSYVIGDRISDVIAGKRAGCTAIQVQTGKHLDKPIESRFMDVSIKPDFVCANLREAIGFILETNR